VDVTTETLTPTRVRLTVTVPFEELSPVVDAAYKKVSGQIRVPGFRPGRVPRQLVDQRVGRAAVLDEALQEALPRFYGQAVEERGVDVLSRPEVDVTTFTDGEPLVFTADVDVRPEVVLGDYQGIPITVDDADVTDADVEETIEGLRTQQGVLLESAEPAAAGDLLTVDVLTRVGGEELTDATATGVTTVLGEGGLVPGLDEAVTGAVAGETRSFTTEIQAGEHAGETGDVTVTVAKVQTRVLPELDDTFAASVGPFASVGELRTAARDNAVRTKRLQQGISARDKLLEALLERAEVPLPESVVHGEEHARRDQFEQQLQSYGLTVESYLDGIGKDAETYAAEQRAESEQAVRSQLVLDAVATKEELGVTEAELSDQVVRRAQRAGIAPDEFARQVVDSGNLQMLVSEVVRGKALALVLEEAVVTDVSGRPVDLDAIREDVPVVGVVDDDSDEGVTTGEVEVDTAVDEAGTPASVADAG